MLWGETRESINLLCIPKMVIRLITGIKKCESCRQKIKEKYNFYSDFTICFRSSVLCKEV